MFDAFVPPIVVGRGLRAKIHEIDLEGGWRPKQPAVVAASEQKFAQQYLMTSMKSPTLMGDAEGKPTLAADGRFVVVDGVSTCTALTNMLSKISESDDDMNLRQRGFTQALTAD